MKFFDDIKIHVQAGNGGNGVVSFRREKFIPRGGPDGGNGGKGGNIILIAKDNINTLFYFYHHTHHKADSGKNGAGQNRTGASGKDTILFVPIGTQVYDVNGKIMLCDLSAKDQEFIIAHGGEAGVGNAVFTTSTNRAPRFATQGKTGESGWFRLILKLISDIGLIGMPNAGKSSIISKLTNADSKVADYQFTTVKPILGVLKNRNRRLTLCDIPGLIKNAHIGYGLGIHFLKHIEKCKALVHIIDCSSKTIISDYRTINNELAKYSSLLKQKSQIVVFNKIDKLSKQELLKKVQKFQKATKIDPILISINEDCHIKEFIQSLFSLCNSNNNKV